MSNITFFLKFLIFYAKKRAINGVSRVVLQNLGRVPF